MRLLQLVLWRDDSSDGPSALAEANRLLSGASAGAGDGGVRVLKLRGAPSRVMLQCRVLDDTATALLATLRGLQPEVLDVIPLHDDPRSPAAARGGGDNDAGARRRRQRDDGGGAAGGAGADDADADVDADAAGAAAMADRQLAMLWRRSGVTRDAVVLLVLSCVVAGFGLATDNRLCVNSVVSKPRSR